VRAWCVRRPWYPGVLVPKSPPLRRNCARSEPVEFGAVLQLLDSFFPINLPTSSIQQISDCHFIPSVKHTHFYLAFWAPFDVLGGVFAAH
jgi:hypothetical protein